MPAPAGASLRVVTVTPRTPNACDQAGEQRQRRFAGQALGGERPDVDAEILRDQQDRVVVAGSRRTCARRPIAALTVCAPGWKRYSGQMSMVPPARSTRVGAEDVTVTAEL